MKRAARIFGIVILAAVAVPGFSQNTGQALVAWYGFPNAGGSAAQPAKPIDEIPQLQHPLLMIHGSADQASPIAGVFQYASALQGAGKYFELKVYQGLPHGFMVQNGQLWRNDKADDALQQMVSFFKRMM